MFNRRKREHLDHEPFVDLVSEAWLTIGDRDRVDEAVGRFASSIIDDSELFRVSSLFLIARLDRMVRDVTPHLEGRDVDEFIDSDVTVRAILCGLGPRFSAIGVYPSTMDRFDRFLHAIMSNRISYPPETFARMDCRDISAMFLALAFGCRVSDPIWDDVERLWNSPTIRPQVEAAMAVEV